MFSRDRSKQPCRRSPATLHGVVFDISVRSDNHAGLALSFLMMIVVANGKSDAAARLRPAAAAPIRLRIHFAQAAPSASSGHERGSHHGVEKRIAARADRCLKRKTKDFGVPSFVSKWRARRDSNS
ncbi:MULTISPECIES: hypothetical protein [unclassified Bradyrhizobium]|uniref:hypothetical protein n=1 Tax=unclassified Bradyrhizobium TaxID=2631580 RepID=UPI002FF15A01